LDKKTKIEAQWKNIVKLGFIVNIVAHNFSIGNGMGDRSDIAYDLRKQLLHRYTIATRLHHWD
jgi:hypothetical protein